jgi:hypothetical protein
MLTDTEKVAVFCTALINAKLPWSWAVVAQFAASQAGESKDYWSLDIARGARFFDSLLGEMKSIDNFDGPVALINGVTQAQVVGKLIKTFFYHAYRSAARQVNAGIGGTPSDKAQGVQQQIKGLLINTMGLPPQLADGAYNSEDMAEAIQHAVAGERGAKDPVRTKAIIEFYFQSSPETPKLQ